MSGWFVYLITILSGIKRALNAVTILSTVIASVSGFFILMAIIDEVELEYQKLENISTTLKKFFRLALLSAVITGTLYCITPSTKDAVLIYVIPKITSNERMQQVPDKILDLLDSYVKKGAKE